MPKHVGVKGVDTLFYSIVAFCWCVKDIINVYCLDVEVFEEKRNLYEHFLEIGECGLSFTLLDCGPEIHKVEQVESKVER